MTHPLSGIRVVEFGHYIAVPAAAQLLVDLGADVIKVEPPAGDQARSIGDFGEGIVRAFNRGKRSVTIDLKSRDGLEQALTLVDDADVMLQNMRAGALEKLGLGVEVLQRRRPNLIHVSVSGFGPNGPSARRPGLDIAAQAESGLMSITGEADGQPQRVGVPVIDSAASYAVAQAVLAALFQRERTGEGAVAEVSLLDVAIHLQATSWGEWQFTGKAPTRKGNGQATVAPAADVVATADGAIVVSAYTTEHFARLCAVIGKPELPQDNRFVDNLARVAHREDLLKELQEAFGEMTTEECVAMLADNGLVAAAVRDYEQVLQAQDVRSSDILTTGVAVNGDEYLVPGLPFTFEGMCVTQGRQVPSQGQHNAEVLS